MDTPTPHLLFAFFSFLGVIRVSGSCKNKPECTKSDVALSQALKRSDTIAICRLLPVSLRCLEHALENCNTDPDTMLSNKIKKELEILKLKLRNSCPDTQKGEKNKANTNFSYVSIMTMASTFVFFIYHQVLL